MTHDPAAVGAPGTPGALSAEQVAALEQRLAAAAAEVASVQAQLAAATGVPAPAPATPQVPYGAPEAPDLQTVLGQAQLPPQATEQLQQVLSRLGLDQTIGAAIGLPVAPAHLPSPGTVAPLAEPPRPVPAGYRLATFDWSWVEAFCLFLFATAPVALWIMVPESRAPGLLVAAVAVVLFRVRRYRRRVGLLRWGKVATVTGARLTERGTYYSGTTYGNARLRSARGWTTTTQWYSGPGNSTEVGYTLDGTAGTVRVSGLPYVDGVVLADSRAPQRAMCVSQFPYDLTPGPDGQWTGRLTTGQWTGVVATLVVETTVVVSAVLAAYDAWVV